eukprot:TRINITY_DN14304_c0_g1_i1.p1 TRINITY_DN14304_c0_g1~~TRINITY_DN14304_c0_g1_i1.p1  ORF type:complete len:664 (+),score=178.29 TRINITY_DN14304_c0_g1_i1:116-2107(+)
MKKLFKAAAFEKPEPTAGFVYRDFAQFTFSDMASSKKLAEALLEKLETFKQPVQMTKTLKMIKHCAQHGHTDFQKTMQKHSDNLRTYANYRGPRDPIHEDKLNQQVRDAAKEAMDAIFSEQATSKVVNSLEGHGANTRDDKVHESSFKDTDSSFKPRSNKLQEAIDARNKKQEGVFSGLKSAVAKLGIGAESSNHENILKQLESDQNSGAGYVGNFGNAPSPQGSSSPAPVWGFKQDESAGPSVSVKDTDVLSPMQQAVNAVTSKSSAPGRGDITKFIKIATSLEAEEGDELAPRLDEKLDQKMGWQTRLNALTLVEALVKAGHQDVIDYFTENPEDIQKNVNVVQTTVKEKAKKVLAALNVPEINATKKAAPIVVPGVPMMYVDPTQYTAEVPLVAEEASAPRKKKGATGLKKRGKKLNSAVPAEPLVQPPASPQGDDLFRMLSSTAPIAPTPMATPVAPSPMPSREVPLASLGNAALDELFYSPPASAAPHEAASAVAGAVSGLDSLFPSADVNHNPAPTPHATPLTKVPLGSGFDFAAFSAAAASVTSPTALPPTPVQSPVCGLAPANAAPVPPAFAGLGEPSPLATHNDMMAQLQAQQAALQAQIEALQRAQAAAHVSTMPLPPGQNMPPMPQPSSGHQTAINNQFAFIGKELEGAMSK